MIQLITLMSFGKLQLSIFFRVMIFIITLVETDFDEKEN